MQFTKCYLLFYHVAIIKRFGVVYEELVGERRGKFCDSMASESAIGGY